MVVLFSEEYAASAGPFRIFLFMLPLRILFHGGFLRALGKTRPIFIGAVGSLALSVLLSLVLVRIPALGLLGPAIAGVVAAYWAVGYTIHVITRTLGWSWRHYFPWRTMAAIASVAIVAALPVALLASRLWGLSALSQLVVLGGAYAALYVLIGETTGLARMHEWRRAISDLLRQR